MPQKATTSLLSVILILGFASVSRAGAVPSTPAGYDDTALEKKARARLERDHLLREASLELTVKNGVARLEGQVESLEQAERARRAVAQTRGLVDLQSALSVPEGADDDRDLADAVGREFERFPSLKGEKLEVAVEEGTAKLGGSVRTAGQRRLALEAARGVPGVRDIRVEMEVREGANDEDATIERQIRGLLADRVRFPIQGRVQVRVRDREAILEGMVQRVIDRIEAEEVAWFAGGVRRIQNLILVVPRPRVRSPSGESAEVDGGEAAPDALQADPETPDEPPKEESNESSP